MANNIEKITSIEEQIEKLKEKRKNLEKQMQQNIGAELLKEWNIESEEEAIKWIQKLAVQVNEKKNNPRRGMSMKLKTDNLAKSQELKKQIADLQKKKSQLQNETQRRASWEQRKARTKRLIETGALAEKYFGLETLTTEEREKVFQTFSGFIKSKIQQK